LFIIQSALIGGLLVSRAKRRYAEDESHTFERAAEDHRKKLAEVISSVPGIVWETRERRNGARQKMAFVSDYARQMLGYSLEEWFSTPGFWLSIVLEEDRERLSADIESALASARRGVTQFRWRAQNGTVLWAEAYLVPVLNQKGEVLCLRGVTIDITERKRTEAQLIELETRFRNMADTAPVMIWVSDRDKLCTYFNKQWLDFTGRTLEEELGNGWTEGIHPDDCEVCLQTYESAFDRGEPFKMEYRLRRADGQFGWVYDSGSPRLSLTGKFLGYIGSCIDITERKAAEQALMDLSGQLIRAREDERARIARDLHDNLHQRVALVSVELDQLIHTPPESEAKLREIARGILKQTAELSAEIHSMSHDLHPSKLVLLGLVPALKSLCVELSHSYGLKIEFKHADVPKVLPEEILLCIYRVVQESLNNVVRHSGSSKAQIELRGTGQCIRLRVSDSGRGFDVESAKSRKGLGLISMRERLRLINGTISIDSRISGGTKIYVAVPLPQMGVGRGNFTLNDRTQAVASD